MTVQELANSSNEELLQFYWRAAELSRGKSPFSKEDIEAELNKRMAGYRPEQANLGKVEGVNVMLERV